MSQWYHVDQETNDVNFCCVQGGLAFYDQNESTGGFTCMPKSHKKFSELDNYRKNSRGGNQLHLRGLTTFDSLQNIPKRLICMKAGDLVLWDSRLFHANTHALIKPDTPSNRLLRLVSYVCMTPTPKNFDTGVLSKRLSSIYNYDTTSHVPWEYNAKKDAKTQPGARAKRHFKEFRVVKRLLDLPPGTEELLSGTAYSTTKNNKKIVIKKKEEEMDKKKKK